MDSFLLQATVFLAAAVIAVPIAARLGLGSVLGYLLAGLAIGPGLGLVADAENIQHFAEFGVVMMLFLIGLELEPRALWDMRHRLIGLGGLQVGLTVGAVTVAGIYAFGLGWQTAIAVGMILSLSSTAIVLQTLNEKRLMTTPGGRAAFSVLLSQDIAVIPMLIVLPLLAVAPVLSAGDAHGDGYGDGHGDHGSLSLVEGLPEWGVALVTLGAVALIVVGGVYGARPLFRYIHAARLPEMFTAVALLIVVGIGFLMMLVGLSPALGTFLAGVVLANSEFRHELESDIEPFKGLLLGVFFITVGAGIDTQAFMGEPFLILGLAIGLLALKGAILFALGWLFGLRGRDHWLFTLGIAQAGEFGFVLVSFGLSTSALDTALSGRLLLVIALTMLITPLLFILYDWIEKRSATRGQDAPEHDRIDEQGPVIIAGVGRFGQIVNRMVQASGYKTVVLDHDMETIQLMRRFGYKGFFGDPTRPELLNAAGLRSAAVLVAALDDPKAQNKLVSYARRLRPDLHIIARAHDRGHVYQLYRAGADDIVREMFDSAVRAGRYVLENVGMTEYEAAVARDTFFHHDRQTVRELAALWDPSVPASENAAYVQRAKELEKDLETALFSALENRAKDDDAA